MGYYFKWDPKKSFNIAKKQGFKNSKIPKTGIYNFADIDDAFLITIHHFMKWYKYGFSRVWDNLSIEIRNKRLSRKQALSIVKKIGHKKTKKEISDLITIWERNNQNFIKFAKNLKIEKYGLKILITNGKLKIL